jgi:peptidoglycan/xylan/chitin deacetylase (PgdA/CDA1 family)
MVWALRARLPPRLRSRARRLGDLALAPRFGSLKGARTTEPIVALTFDDGPDPIGTSAVLDALARMSSRATFFMLTEQAEAFPDLARRVVREGHEVGLHGTTHLRPATLPPARLKAWIAEGRRRLEAVIERPVRLFRPPFGSQSLRSFLAIRSLGLDVVVWSADAADWEEGSPAEIARLGLAGLAPGAVLLLHDGYAPDPQDPRSGPERDRGETVARLLAGISARGYQATSLDGLLQGRRALRTAWFRP